MWPARVVAVAVAVAVAVTTVAVVIVMLVYCLTCRAVVQAPSLLYFPRCAVLPVSLKAANAGEGNLRQVTSAQESARTYLFTYQVRGLFSATTRSNNNRSWQPLCSLLPFFPAPLHPCLCCFLCNRQTKKLI